jgi:outer membrane receptor protein involved in Fe transport
VQPAFPFGPVDPVRVALAEGCVPLDMFGNAPLTQAQHDYAFGDLLEHNRIKQDVLAFNVNGELWQGWGTGPLYAAAGVEYREEKLTNDAADLPFDQRTDFAAQYGDPFAGHTQVKEAYVTLEMSLLKNAAFARDVRMNVAGRRTSNRSADDLAASNPDTNVSTSTWKLGAVWDVTDWLRFRGSRSRDLRAAGFRELYFSLSTAADPPGSFFGAGGAFNPWLPAGFFGPTYDPAVVVLSGNSSLKPEKATTTTLGLVLNPSGWAEGMQFSLDWYRIRLVDGISGGLLASVIDRCYAGDEFYCSQIEGTAGQAGIPGAPGVTLPGPNGSYGFSDITRVRVPYENGRPYRAEGLDINWDHSFALDRLVGGAPGKIVLRASATRALKTTIETLQYPNYVSRNVVGQVGQAAFLADYAPTPKWLGNFMLSYLNGPAAVSLQAQWTGAGRLNAEAPWIDSGDEGYDPALVGTVDDNHVGNYFNFNLNGSYRLPGEHLDKEVFLTVSNVFDKAPPFSNGTIGGVNGTFYDTLGRSFRIGFRMKF